MNEVLKLRQRVGVTQAVLADLTGTSQPTIAAYEGGTKTPTVRTLQRLATAAGLHMTIEFVPPLTREDRRSLFLHHAIALELKNNPDVVRRSAQKNIRLMKQKNPGAKSLLNQWEVLLKLPVEALQSVIVDERPYARELRQTTPFAGILSADARAKVYRNFRANEEGET
ncbi:MAG: hypothetical protein A2289_03005 [Deltaproteobacteria bacterium RIFOXYA12_FULL_58_15]|nr:MAG: hypothetical protein A2289_03005 [Deltaproteobacteria bacterium RIFOXYA12_FULL_58_15]OGR13213.1 MAG: hypothetical protein A2341_15420 [Deltaproteobacteria bacterium RIFOXYB12_FULL_58_9]